MGATTSSIVSEIYLQYVEHTNIVQVLNQHKILGYFLYVDDFLLVCDNTDIDIVNAVQRFSSIHRTLIFSKQGETDNSLNFLDVTLRTGSNFAVTIFRKPTTDCIIRNTSCRSPSQNLAFIRFFCNRAHTCPLEDEEKEKETHIIRQAVENNHYDTNVKKILGISATRKFGENGKMNRMQQ
jgi:hypothetical protein